MSLVADSTRVEGSLAAAVGPDLIDPQVLVQERGMEFLEASNTSTDIAMETDVIQDLCSITAQDEPSRDSSGTLLPEPLITIDPTEEDSLPVVITVPRQLTEDGGDSEKENTDVSESQLQIAIEEEDLTEEVEEEQVSSSSVEIGEKVDGDIVAPDSSESVTSAADPAVTMVTGSQAIAGHDEIIIIESGGEEEPGEEGSEGNIITSSKPGNELPPPLTLSTPTSSRSASTDTVLITSGGDSTTDDVKLDKSDTVKQLSQNIIKAVNDIKSKDAAKIQNPQDFLQKISRSELDKIIQDKLIEAISVHSNVGQLNQKLLETEAQKDRLVSHVVNLQKQVKELMKAIKTVTENSGRNQGQQNRGNQPMRFYRSVGVQVVLDSPLLPLPNGVPEGKILESKVKTVLKSGNNNSSQIIRPLSNIQSNTMVTQLNGTSNPGLKRPLNYPTVSMMNAANGNLITDAQGNKLRRVVNGDASHAQPVSAVVKGMPQMASNAITLTPYNPQHRNPSPRAIAPATSKNSGVVVDLTDDDAPRSVATSLNNVNPRQNVVVTSTAAGRVMGQNGNLLVTQNGVLRFLNPTQPIQYLQGGLQILQNGTSVRPLVLTPGTPPRLSASPSGVQQRQVVPLVRGILPNQSPVNKPSQVIMRPIVPRTTGQTIPGLPPGARLITTNANMSPNLQNRPTSIQQIINKPSPTNQTVVRVGNPNVPAGIAITHPVRPMARAPEPPRKFTLPPLPPPAVTGNPRRCPKDIPPRPDLSLKEQNGGIVLSWTLKLGVNHAEIQTYQIYACQEPLSFTQPLKSATWKRVGDVKALPLPMACTLSQFTDDNRYHFIVRGVDVYNRTGPFCEAAAITLKRNPK